MPKASDLDKLQGTWDIVTLEMDGQTVPSAGAQITVTGESFSTTGMGAVYDGAILLDPTAKPKALDLIFATGPEKGNRAPAIYKLTRDSWTLCLAVTAKTRPLKFAAPAGNGYALETLRRGAAEDAKPAPAAVAAEHATTLELDGEWQMIDCVRDGKPLSEGYLQYGKRAATGNETTVTMMGQTILAARYSVDTSTDPMSIDYHLTEGPSKGGTQLGIWKREGSDFITCFAPPGAPRPTGFTTKAGDGRTLTTWRPVLSL